MGYYIGMFLFVGGCLGIIGFVGWEYGAWDEIKRKWRNLGWWSR